MIKRKIRFFLILGILIAGGRVVNSFAHAPLSAAEDKRDLRISYLSSTDINISSQGINRIHFEKAKIIKIIGDTSRY